MKTRIRSLKPEALTDAELWDAELETGLPLYRAFTGLWCCADREGLFQWKARELKTHCLPYWDGNFEDVLQVLTTRGFLLRYTVRGKVYGKVRTFKDHQSINGKEPASNLPAPDESEDIPDTSRVDHASTTRTQGVVHAPFPSSTRSVPVPFLSSGVPSLSSLPPDLPTRLDHPPDDDPDNFVPDFEETTRVDIPSLRIEPPPKSVTRPSSPPPAPEPRRVTVAAPGQKRDPFRAPHHQEDVIRAFELWKAWAKQPNSRMTHGDPRARGIQDRLDTYGPDSFALMLDGASHDDWVQGRADGTEHKRLDYLLGSVSPAKYEELMALGERVRAGDIPPSRQVRPQRQPRQGEHGWRRQPDAGVINLDTLVEDETEQTGTNDG